MSAGWGVGIVSRFPLERLGPERVDRPGEAPGDSSRPDNALRFVGALVHAGRADVAVASIHLKCCGGKDGREDLARMAEARLINRLFGEALGKSPAPIRLIAGDFNLVGSRPPLDLVRAGLDLDGSELAVAEPLVLGDRAPTTWIDPTTPFTPGRLDFAVYSDSTAAPEQAFVLDTTLLSDAALARAGLQRLDSRASDHMPVVIDLRPGP
jgi:endonuclease/exonuclease/phosphatase family metal-dependent hydrolase